jgi:hypothetical protein
MPDSTEFITRFSKLGRILACFVGGMLALQQSMAEDKSIHMPETAAFALAPMDLCTFSADGFLSGDLFGALSENIQWLGDDMECGGMLRPDDNGIRLVFAAPRQDERLLIVLGIDGKLDELVDGEHAANITIVDEVNNRFFSTGRQERCWAAIELVQPVTEQVMTIAGEVYCAGSLPSLSDNSSIVIRDIHFSGRLLLDESTQN